jgi:peptidoglycan/LPS O-acetylase OafA/YrhL
MSSPSDVNPRPRLIQLDGLRAIAITSVFLYHSFQLPMLWMGVDLFFVLSGFLITGILLDRNAQQKTYFSYFYARRARRILPPYVLLMTITTLILGTLWMRHWYWFAFFCMNIADVLGQNGYYALTPLWSLAVEEQFYLVWPVLIRSFTEEHLPWVAGTILIVSPLLRALATPHFHTHFAIYVLTPFRIDGLMAGALIALAWKNKRAELGKVAGWAKGVIPLAFIVLAVLYRVGGLRVSSNTVVSNVFIYELITLIAAFMLLWALFSKSCLVDVLKWRPVRYVGVISYTIYLVHILAFELSERYVHGRFMVFITALAGTMAYASLSWFLMEKPITGGVSLIRTDSQ